MSTRDALIMVLSHVDWTSSGDANPDAPLCASVPQAVIRHARSALDNAEDAELNQKLRESIARNAAKMRPER